MNLLLVLFVLTLALLFVVLLQSNYQRTKKKHVKKMAFLRRKLAALTKKNYELYQKVTHLESFDDYYTSSRKTIARSIVDLQFELFKNQSNQ